MDSTFLFKVTVYVNVVHISYQKGEKKGGMVKREKGREGEKREGKAGRQERTILLMLRGDRPLITSHLPPTPGDLPQVTYHWWPASPHHRIDLLYSLHPNPGTNEICGSQSPPLPHTHLLPPGDVAHGKPLAILNGVCCGSQIQ